MQFPGVGGGAPPTTLFLLRNGRGVVLADSRVSRDTRRVIGLAPDFSALAVDIASLLAARSIVVSMSPSIAAW